MIDWSNMGLGEPLLGNGTDQAQVAGDPACNVMSSAHCIAGCLFLPGNYSKRNTALFRDRDGFVTECIAD